MCIGLILYSNQRSRLDFYFLNNHRPNIQKFCYVKFKIKYVLLFKYFILQHGLQHIILSMHIFINVQFLILTLTLISLKLACPNCLDCQENQNICFACSDGYQTDVNGRCVRKTIDKCRLYGPVPQVCYKCQVGYRLADTNTCQISYTGCLYLDGTGLCFTECGFGRVLQGVSCVGTINCAQYQLQCTRCAEGYQLQNNICRDISIGCARVRQDDGICQFCKPGYFLSGFKCFQKQYKQERCQVLDSGYKCKYCKQGLINSNGECYTRSQLNQLKQRQLQLNQMKRHQVLLDQIKKRQLQLNQLKKQPNKQQQLQQSQKIYNRLNNQLDKQRYQQRLRYQNNQNSVPLSFDFNANERSGAQIINQIKDPNCLKIRNNVCTNCSQNYFLDLQGRCILRDPLCKQFNNRGGCKQCYNGYFLQDGRCLVYGPKIQIEKCQKVNGNICQQCQRPYYFNTTQGRCIPGDPLCRQINNRGQCTQCYPGYFLQDAKCLVYVPKIQIEKCQKVSGNICQQCQKRYYFDTTLNKCEVVNPYCKTHNKSTGACLTCFQQNELIPAKGTCQIIPKDINCKQFAPNNKSCKQCSNRFYIGPNGKCANVDRQCKQYNSTTGACKSCLNSSYVVKNGACVIGTSVDANCRKFEGSACVLCADRYFAGDDGKCANVDRQCKQYNSTTGACKSCLNSSYVVKNGACVIGTSVDANCRKFEGSACVLCADRYFAGDDGKCTKVSSLCKDYDDTDGSCTSCIDGYQLDSGKCRVIVKKIILDKNCKIFDQIEQDFCVQCQTGYLSIKGICKPQKPQCKTVNLNTGGCMSCKTGFKLQKSDCIAKKQTNNTSSNVNFMWQDFDV